MARPKGKCEDCGARVTITEAGPLRVHGPREDRCPGSNYTDLPKSEGGRLDDDAQGVDEAGDNSIVITGQDGVTGEDIQLIGGGDAPSGAAPEADPRPFKVRVEVPGSGGWSLMSEHANRAAAHAWAAACLFPTHVDGPDGLGWTETPGTASGWGWTAEQIERGEHRADGQHTLLDGRKVEIKDGKPHLPDPEHKENVTVIPDNPTASDPAMAVAIPGTLEDFWAQEWGEEDGYTLPGQPEPSPEPPREHGPALREGAKVRVKLPGGSGSTWGLVQFDDSGELVVELVGG